MKNKILYLLSSVLFLASCDPMADTYSLIDQNAAPYAESKAITLVNGDYTTIKTLALKDAKTKRDSTYIKLIDTNKSFSDSAQAKDYIPAYLANAFKALNKKSSIMVTYNFNMGRSTMTPYETNVYNLSTADYTSVSPEVAAAGSFFPASPAANYIPAILKVDFPTPAANEIKLVFYKNMATNPVDGSPAPATSIVGKYYKFGTAWVEMTTAYALSTDDYKAMGPGPGKYSNFSSTANPIDYIPTMLKSKYPYAQKGTTMIVSYKYFNRAGDAKTLDEASEYTFDGSAWVVNTFIVAKTEQFIHNGTKWLLDPTVSFTMASADYKIIVDYVKGTLANGSTYVDSYGTSEFYYGASSYYNNFDLRLSNKTKYVIPGFDGLSESDGLKRVWEQLKEGLAIMLKGKFPEATTQASGVDVHYKITLNTYENDLSKKSYVYDFQCTKSAPNPEFTWVSGPTLK
ncbi:MAG: hypothetical protein PHV20_02690 [Bacteroidales bacterium]|nr:hypothetical protein [Bacteroidales bacterium]